MSLATLAAIAARVKAVVPAATTELARHWVELAWMRLAERRNWSWRLRKTAIRIPAAHTTGTVTVTAQSTTVLGAAAGFTAAMAGRQFRVGVSPLYTILAVDVAAQTLTLDAAWASDTAAGQSYTILQAYITPPDDFLAWISVVDHVEQRRLNLDISQDELDVRDPSRQWAGGPPAALVGVEYTRESAGIVHAPIYVTLDTFPGLGPSPWMYMYARGTYTGQEDATFLIRLTSSSTFAYKKEGAADYSGNIAMNIGNWVNVAEGVQIYFPPPPELLSDIFFLTGEIWYVRVSAASYPGSPRYEVYPHPTSAYTLAGYYLTRTTELSDRGGILPRFIRGDVLLELALEQAASWPGADDLHPSPYDQISRREWHHAQAEILQNELERVDNEVMQRDLSHLDTYSVASLPWVGIRQDNIY